MPVARLALLTIVVAALSSAAKAEDRVFAGYAVDWQGLHIGAFEAELRTGPGRYELLYEARTEGLIGWLFPFVANGSSIGARVAGEVMPERFQGESMWRDNDRSWAVAFDADGRAIEVEVPEDDRDPVPEELQVAPDPLALLLAAIDGAAPSAQMSGNSFDGRRVLTFEVDCAPTMVAFTDVPAGAAAAADREALTCTVAGELIAGGSRRWRDRDDEDEDREPATVWLSDGIVEDHLWPVRVVGESRYGTVTVNLVHLERGEPAPTN